VLPSCPQTWNPGIGRNCLYLLALNSLSEEDAVWLSTNIGGTHTAWELGRPFERSRSLQISWSKPVLFDILTLRFCERNHITCWEYLKFSKRMRFKQVNNQ
jgi:hypothetical protein